MIFGTTPKRARRWVSLLPRSLRAHTSSPQPGENAARAYIYDGRSGKVHVLPARYGERP